MMEIFLSEQAETDLDEIVAYLAKNWSAKTKTDFLASLSDKMRLIEQMPEMYRTSQKRAGLRECVVNRHTIMYYKVMAEIETIEVVAFVSTRQNN